jgi:hypothetical protein
MEVENADTHSWMAYIQFHNFHFPQRHMVTQVRFRAVMAFRDEVPPVLLAVQPVFSTSSMSADTLLYHFAMEDNRPNDFS